MSTTPLDAVLSHWSKLFENFQTSPRPFYDSVEAAIARREIPDVALERIEYKEGGLISPRREYLRVKRGKHAFDVCAAPFGTGFFFSTWLTTVPVLNGVQKLLIFMGMFFAFIFFTALVPFFLGPIVFLFVLLF